MNIAPGDWMKVQMGIADSYRGAGFSRWMVTEVRESGEIRLYRLWQNEVYTWTVCPSQLTAWERCDAPKAWCP